MDKVTILCLLCYIIWNVNGDGDCPVRGDYTLENDRRCRRPCTKKSDCKKETKECLCDTECGMSCFNPSGDCGSPGNISNGRVEHDHSLWGGKARYYCDDGYSLNGTRERKCNADKKWGGPPPTCERVCNDPNDEQQSYSIDDVYFVGRSYRFSCRTGYYLKGDPNRECLDDGTWSNLLYNCLVQHCDSIDTIRNGDVDFTMGLRFGSTASVICHKGYEISNKRQVMRCYPGEEGSRYAEWVGSLPTCNIILCPAPESLDHGSIRDRDYITLEYGTRIEYQCSQGYKLKGPETGICNENRTWGEVPTCIVNPDCDFRDSFCGYDSTGWERFAVTESGNLGYAVRSTAGSSYLLSKMLDGDWAERSMCLNFYYKLPTGPREELKIEKSNGKVIWKTHWKESLGTWKNAAVTLIPSLNMIFQFHSQIQGILLDNIAAFPRECENHCSPQKCQNGGTCINRIRGYTCFCTNEFTGQNCDIDKRCTSALRSIPNGYLQHSPRNRLPGATATYACNQHFKFPSRSQEILREKVITCVQIGRTGKSKWSTSLQNLRCEKITCARVHPLDNSRLLNPQGVWTVGETARFKCDAGFVPWNGRNAAPTEIDCMPNGQWRYSLPTCVRPHCTYDARDETLKPINQQEKYPVGSKIYFKCPFGYSLSKPTNVECTRMMRWETKFPTCRRLQYTCPNPPPPLKKGFVHVTANRKITFSCRKMFCLNGRSSMICGPGGRWYGNPPTCEACPNERVTVYNWQYLAFTSHDLKSTFDEAQNRCREVGGNLALLYADWIRQQVRNNLLSKLGNYGDMYMGYERIRPLRRVTFVWIAKNLAFVLPPDWKKERTSNWDRQANEPNWGSNKMCATVHYTSKSEPDKWRTAHCNFKASFLCQKKESPCSPNPCQNGGTCTERARDFTCRCTPNFKGRDCTTEIHCNFRVFIEKNYRALDKERYLGGDIVPLVCEPGYQSSDGAASEATCQANGRWTSEENRCQPITCQAPEVPPRIQTDSRDRSYSFGKTIYLSCSGRYELSGKNVIQCQPDGTWSTTNATCEDAACDRPDLPPFSYIVEDEEFFPFGTSITLECQEGRSLRGGGSQWRCDNGNWIKTEAKCVDTACERPEVPPFSYIVEDADNFPSGTSITLECEEGRSLRGGESQWRCDDRNWIKSDAKCVGIACGFPKLPQFSYIVESVDQFPTGTSITLQCEGRRSLQNGDNRWRCENGNWITTDVKCVVQFCSVNYYLMPSGLEVKNFPDIESEKQFDAGTILTLICEDRSVPIHYDDNEIPPIIECSGGRWNTSYSGFDCGN